MKNLFCIIFILLIPVSLFASQNSDYDKFLNFSDIHFDPFSDTVIVDELKNSDYTQWEKIFQNSDNKTYSSYGSDCNFYLFQSALKDMSERIPNPDFVIITGDFMSHNFNENFEKYTGIKDQDSLNKFIEKTIRFITTMIVNSFPNTNIFPTVGNDDAYCGNYMIDPEGEFLKMTAKVWQPIVNMKSNNQNFEKDFAKGGYCISNISENTNYKIIILNTVFFSSKYKNHCGDTSADPGADALKWLTETLEVCKNNQQKVYLSYHIPPGIDIYATINGKGNCEEKIFSSWKENYTKEFIDIIKKYQNNIIAAFAGHFHRDDFRLFYENEEPVSFLHITSSISPIYGNNPSYQIFTYDKSDFSLINFETYYLKNISIPDSAKWTFEYDFQNCYRQDSISSSSLNSVYKSIQSDSSYRVKYIEYYTSSSTSTFEKDYINWKYNWCGIKYFTKEEYAKCFCKLSGRR